jgi:hypothetical protein
MRRGSNGGRGRSGMGYCGDSYGPAGYGRGGGAPCQPGGRAGRAGANAGGGMGMASSM